LRESFPFEHFFATAVFASGLSLLSADFLTAGGDAARTGWIRNEKILTPQNVKGHELFWKVKLNSPAR
jgi:hypothetical protein